MFLNSEHIQTKVKALGVFQMSTLNRESGFWNSVKLTNVLAGYLHIQRTRSNISIHFVLCFWPSVNYESNILSHSTFLHHLLRKTMRVLYMLYSLGSVWKLTGQWDFSSIEELKMQQNMWIKW